MKQLAEGAPLQGNYFGGYIQIDYKFFIQILGTKIRFIKIVLGATMRVQVQEKIQRVG